MLGGFCSFYVYFGLFDVRTMGVCATNSREEYEAGKRAVELRKIQRKETLAWLEAYTRSVVSKLAGLVGVVCGSLGIVNPTLFPSIRHPVYFVGVGLALLTGKTVVNLIAKAVE